MSNSPDIQKEKAALRSKMRALLSATTPAQRQAWSEEIVARLQDSGVWGRAPRTVAMFGGLQSEPDLMPLFSWLHERGMCTVFFAVAADGCMKVHDVREEKELVRGSLGVLEPDAHHCPQMDEALIDIALVPGLAFSQVDGLRLGRGKGCYDRVLARLRPDAKTIGIGFTLQMLPQVPAGPLDARVHSLLSEDGWINF